MNFHGFIQFESTQVNSSFYRVQCKQIARSFGTNQILDLKYIFSFHVKNIEIDGIVFLNRYVIIQNRIKRIWRYDKRQSAILGINQYTLKYTEKERDGKRKERGNERTREREREE